MKSQPGEGGGGELDGDLLEDLARVQVVLTEGLTVELSGGPHLHHLIGQTIGLDGRSSSLGLVKIYRGTGMGKGRDER